MLSPQAELSRQFFAPYRVVGQDPAGHPGPCANAESFEWMG